MEGRRCRDLVSRKMDCRCYRREGDLVTERGAHRGSYKENNSPKANDWKNERGIFLSFYNQQGSKTGVLEFAPVEKEGRWPGFRQSEDLPRMH